MFFIIVVVIIIIIIIIIIVIIIITVVFALFVHSDWRATIKIRLSKINFCTSLDILFNGKTKFIYLPTYLLWSANLTKIPYFPILPSAYKNKLQNKAIQNMSNDEIWQSIIVIIIIFLKNTI